MKRAKRNGMALTALLCAAALTGCGPALDEKSLFEGILSGENSSGENDSEKNGSEENNSEENGSEGEDFGSLPSNSEKDSEIMTEFTFDDIEGYWYGVSDKGIVYTMQIYRPSENMGKLVFSILGDEVTSFNNGVRISPVYETSPSGVVRTDEDGNLVAKKDADGNIINCFKGEHYGRYGSNPSPSFSIEGNPYTDGSLHVTASIIDSDPQAPKEDTIVFTHTFSLPALEINREEGTLSGIWYASLEEPEDPRYVLIAYPDGTFYMWEVAEESSFISGDYQMNKDTVTLTAKRMDGKPYEGSDTAISTTLRADNSIDADSVVMSPAIGKQSGSWIYDPAEETEGSEVVFYLDVDENGGFTIRIMEDEVTQELIGLCLYRSDTEADLLICADDYGSGFYIAGSFIIWSDGAATVTSDPNDPDDTLHLRKN